VSGASEREREDAALARSHICLFFIISDSEGIHIGKTHIHAYIYVLAAYMRAYIWGDISLVCAPLLAGLPPLCAKQLTPNWNSLLAKNAHLLQPANPALETRRAGWELCFGRARNHIKLLISISDQFLFTYPSLDKKLLLCFSFH